MSKKIVLDPGHSNKRGGKSAVKKERNTIPLNFRVTKEFRMKFKMLAAEKDMKLSEMLRVMFEQFSNQSH